MYEKGVVKVGDLLDHNNQPLSLTNFKQKFALCTFPITLYYGIISAIPRHWKENFGNENLNVTEDNVMDGVIHVPPLSRHIYKSLIDNITVPPVAISKWKNVFQFHDLQWQTIFRTPFASCTESKIRYFQFRFFCTAF